MTTFLRWQFYINEFVIVWLDSYLELGLENLMKYVILEALNGEADEFCITENALGLLCNKLGAEEACIGPYIKHYVFEQNKNVVFPHEWSCAYCIMASLWNIWISNEVFCLKWFKFWSQLTIYFGGIRKPCGQRGGRKVAKKSWKSAWEGGF